VPVEAGSWKTRRDSKVTIGIGKVSRERRIMGAQAIMEQQRTLVQDGAMGTLVLPHQMHAARKMWAEAWGFESDLFFQDPRQLPPPPPKGPDPQQQLMEAQSQAMLMDGQSKMLRAQNEQAKIALERERLTVEAQYKQTESFLRQQMEALKAQQKQMQAEAEVTGKIVSMQHEQTMRDNANQIANLKVQLDHLNATRDRDLEYYKTAVTLAAKGETPEGYEQRKENEAAEMAADAQKTMEREMREGQRDALLVEMFNTLRQEFEAMKQPKTRVLDYDEKGLLKSIDGQPVERDESGKVRRIG